MDKDNIEEYLKYYKEILKMSPEDYDNFEKSIQSPLPYTFRIVETEYKKVIEEKMNEKFAGFYFPFSHFKNTFCFYKPSQLGDEQNESFGEFFEFVVTLTNAGLMQRQEIVSMIPVFFLDVKKDSLVYEPCAAPGSKTKQILELLDGSGILVANEIKKKRMNILVNEANKRPNVNFMITRLDASIFPRPNENFTRICCDVPCTGDGTIRKNSDVTTNWSTEEGPRQVKLQSKILQRSLEMLSEDGILVYSTCSLNPIENEFVVNSVALSKGEFELFLPEELFEETFTYDRLNTDKFIVRKGITEFNYKSKKREFSFDNPDLEKCIRIYPHDNNTGGFFIAVIRRKTERKLQKKEIQQKANSKGFFDVPADISEKLVSFDFKMVSYSIKYNSIFAVSHQLYDFILNNPKLRLSMAGMKAYEKDINLENKEAKERFYRGKTSYMTKFNFQADAVMNIKQFLMFEAGKSVEKSELGDFNITGYFTVNLEGTKEKFCGFASNKKVLLYIPNKITKFLRILYE
ncbi:nsun2 [Nucleospora cyclopteri]